MAFSVIPFGSQLALSAFGYSLSYRDAFRGYFLAQPAKYLPGGLWVVPGRALALSELGVQVAHSSGAQLIEVCFMLVATVLVFTPYLLIGETVSHSLPLVGLVCVLAAAMLICLHPALFNRAASWVFRRLGQAEVAVSLSFQIIAGMLMTYVAFWIGAGVGFNLLISSVHEIPLRHAPIVVASLSMAWFAGYVAFLVPAGVGVREGTLALLLSRILPSPLPAVLALLARVWWTAAELVLVLAAVKQGRQNSASDGAGE